VELLARQSGLATTNASNHLKELRNAGLVATRKDGAYVHYRLADPAVHEFLRSLQDIARRQLAEARQIVQEYYEEPGALEPVAAKELLARMRANDVVVLDVRPADEYAAGHIPGAISIPVDELKRRLSELPRKRSRCLLSWPVLRVRVAGDRHSARGSLPCATPVGRCAGLARCGSCRGRWTAGDCTQDAEREKAMILRQYLHTEPVMAASCLFGCGGKGMGAVVDPMDDIEHYLRESELLGLRIRQVIDTHVCAHDTSVAADWLKRLDWFVAAVSPGRRHPRLDLSGASTARLRC
jgi:rhodanese-related sulfurtransferase